MRPPAHISRRLKLRHLNALTAVAQWGNMAKAAEHLAISQPAVSKAIADLENILGVRLLDRRPQGVELTLYGRALLKRSIAIFNDLRTSLNELAFLEDPTAGELRIGTTEPMAAGLTGAIVDRLSRQYPKIAFRVAIGEVPELIDEPWALSTPESYPGSLIEEAFRACGLVVPRSGVTTQSLHMMNVLLSTGRFLTILPAALLHFSAKRLGFKILPVDLPYKPRPVGIVTLRIERSARWHNSLSRVRARL